MTQYYIGCKQIQGFEQAKDGQPGYGVIYPDGYQSWSPKAVFEAAYLPMGFVPLAMPDGQPNTTMANATRITQEMVDDFIGQIAVRKLGEKTTVVHVTLKNGYEIVESSSCVEPVNYNEEMGSKICLDRIKNKVWMLLGFLLQTARFGLNGSGIAQ